MILSCLKSQSNNHYSDSSNSYSTNICSTLKPPKSLSNLYNKFNNFSSQQNRNTENIIKWKYYDVEEIQSLNSLNHEDALILFHINTCSLPKNFEELQFLLDKTKIDFDVIIISESKIKKDTSPINSINLKGYSNESCPTESAVGGTLLHISNHVSYTPRNDLCIYKSTRLESTFFEILNPAKTNVMAG